METKEYIQTENPVLTAEEPVATYGVHTDSFEQDWSHALSIDEFRDRCQAKLVEIYG